MNNKLTLILAIAAAVSANTNATAAHHEGSEPTSKMNTCDDTCAIMKADSAFSDRAQEIGVPAAFLEFAADGAVMYRNGMEPIIGKDAIAKAMAGEENVSLIWTPLTCDMAESGELGYSRGSFVLNIPASGDQPAQGPITGFYVSIWKKQTDGSWKWVFDSGIISKMP